MRIGIDARCLEGKRTGEGRYLVNILKQWANSYPDNDYFLYFRLNIANDDIFNHKCFSKNRMNVKIKPREQIWQHIYLANQIKNNKIDILFCPSYTKPLHCTKKSIVTIHDISYAVHPNWFPIKSQIRLRPFSYLAAKTCNLILTVSKFSKSEIVNYYKVPEKKVKVIYEAADPKFKILKNEDKKIKKVKQKYNIEKEFILYIGAILNRRNVDKLMLAFRALCTEIDDYQIVIAGANYSYPYLNIKQFIKKYDLNNKILYIDYIEEEDVVLLYNAATLFIWPSIYEGFGLPLLESMACGTPVITSCCASIPEVVGNASLIVNPENVKEMIDGMKKIILDKNFREKLIHKGLERIKLFSWEKCSKETMKIIEEIYNEK